jgi:putative transcriptional regulator
MGERKLKISDLVRETNINRGSITRLYHEKANRVDLDLVDTLCRYFKCEIGDLFEFIENEEND